MEIKEKYQSLLRRVEQSEAAIEGELNRRNNGGIPSTVASLPTNAEGDVENDDDDDDDTAPILSPVKSQRALKSDSPEY